MSADNPLLRVKDMTVTFGHGHNRFTAVKNVSFDVYKGETFGIVGESGSGKTTIGRTIMRINPLSGGTVEYNGEIISGKLTRACDRELTRKIQMIFQDPMSSLNERAKIDYIVGEGLYNLGGLSVEERESRVAKALAEVGLRPEFASRFPHEFSGGQRQRVGIARAIVMRPEFIVADEPISALDVSIRAQVLNLMSRLKRELGLTYIFISHDLSVMRFICDRIGAIYKGEFVELADTETLYTRPLHPYTRALLSAIPQPDPRQERQKAIVAYDSTVHDYSKEKPVWSEIEPGHFVLADTGELESYRARLDALDKGAENG